MISVSRWDLLHLLLSIGNPPLCDRDRRELRAVCRRAYVALLAVSAPVRIPVRP